MFYLFLFLFSVFLFRLPDLWLGVNISIRSSVDWRKCYWSSRNTHSKDGGQFFGEDFFPDNDRPRYFGTAFVNTRTVHRITLAKGNMAGMATIVTVKC